MIHIGVVIVVVGLAGSAFNRSEERELALHDKLIDRPLHAGVGGLLRKTPIPTTTRNMRCWMFTQRRQAVSDVAGEACLPGQRTAADHGGHPLDVPWDLYVVYEGTNPDTGQPIIKAFLNPLVGWIWVGVAFIVFGTVVALVPSLSPATAALRAAAPVIPTEPILGGGVR